MSVIYYSKPKNEFSDIYITVRKKETRFFSQEQIKNLPDLNKTHIHYSEWKLRKKSALRFVEYLKNKNKPLKILDVGCGNGWFSHLMSTIEKVKVVGIDVNTIELEQATKAFSKENLIFAYANLFELTELNNQKFDIIVFNSCLQYFKDLDELFQIIQDLLTVNGEIHITDSPFYKNSEIESAKQRTQKYYENMGFAQMTENYFHHRFNDLGKFKILYKPLTSLLKYLRKDSPFYWISLDIPILKKTKF